MGIERVLQARISFWAVEMTAGYWWMAGRNFSCISQMKRDGFRKRRGRAMMEAVMGRCRSSKYSNCYASRRCLDVLRLPAAETERSDLSAGQLLCGKVLAKELRIVYRNPGTDRGSSSYCLQLYTTSLQHLDTVTLF